jgi:hypothetical protein
MERKKVLFYLSSISLITLFAITSLLFWRNHEIATIKQSEILEATSDVWIYNCELPEQKPKSILLTCADGGIRIEQLSWSDWSSTSAFGYGTYLENNCDPDCSEGKYIATEVTVELDQLIQHKGKLFFKILKISSSQDQKQLQEQITPNWDIFDFGQMMNQ